MSKRSGAEQSRSLDLCGGLARLGVSEALTAQASELVPADAIGVLVYGSRARGDWVESSDLDLLVLVRSPRLSRRTAAVSLSCYTEDQLRSASGTIFGFHLARDGVIAVDTENALGAILAQFGDPDPQRLRHRIRRLAALLETGADDRELYLPGLCRLARYLLRTAVYLAAFAEGRPCFSIRELAERYEEPALTTILASDPDAVPEPSADELDALADRLRVFAGDPIPIRETSLEDIAVAYWDDDSMMSQIATLAMAGKGDEFDYSQMSRILL